MEILSVLRDMGFERDCLGRKYLAECLSLYLESGMNFTQIYEILAARHGRTAMSVMKAMKYAIDGAVLSQGRSDFLARLVRDNGSITVREFVSELAVWLRQGFGESGKI